MARFFFLTAVAAMLAAACTTTSPTGRTQLNLVSDAEIQQMGVTAFEQMKQKVPPTTDGRVSGYVSCVANAITREVGGGNWEVRVFNDKQVNAFALPGGKIGVYSGLLRVASNQDQLASVIAHEVSHVIARHHNARISNQMATQLGSVLVGGAVGVDPNLINAGAGVFLLRFDRKDESEADQLGQDVMARAGFDPRQSIELWYRMQQAETGNAPPPWLSTHPSHEARIRDLTAHLSQTMPVYQQAQASGKRPRCS
ncbi:MAG TPA: M48 family metallopeptidase [Solimonas sp.]|nr:M48 family metallopeptidase [Solimonas sp.]